MKYLYLNGTDLLGPIEAQDLVKLPSFSADMLVCPEEHGEDENYWKVAQVYPDLIGANVNQVKQEINTKTSVPPTPPKVQNTSKNNEVATKIDLTQEPKTEDDLLQTDSSLTSKKHNLTEDNLETTLHEQSPLNASLDNNFLEDIPSSAILTPNNLDNQPILVGGTKEQQKKLQDQKDAKPMDHATPLEAGAKDIFNEDNRIKSSFMEISNNKIISSTDGRIKDNNQEQKNDIIFILSVVVLVIIGIAIFMAFFNNMRDNKTPQQQVSQEEILNNIEPLTEENITIQEPIEPAIQGIQEEIETQQEPIIKDENLDNTLINAVKNIPLKNKNMTIQEYLENTYSNYTTKWNVKPLFNNTYVVEFFASQMRSEPIVYLFRVDKETLTITGGLNNITMDLLK